MAREAIGPDGPGDGRGRRDGAHGPTRPSGACGGVAKARKADHPRGQAGSDVPGYRKPASKRLAKAAVLRAREPIAGIVTHVALPGYEIARTAHRRETVATFLKRSGWATRGKRGWEFHNTKLPTICVINGDLCRRRDWRKRRIKAGDEVRFVSRPLGGGVSGGQIAGLVALIALTAFAPYLGGLAVGSAFGSAAAAFTVGSTGVTLGALTGSLLVAGAGLLVATLLRPKTADQQEGKPLDQIYTVSASGNLARPLQPIKLSYGRIKTFPDYVATPWSEFGGKEIIPANTATETTDVGSPVPGAQESANDQYLNLILNIGLGDYETEEILIDDTPLWNSDDGILENFDNVKIEFYDPGDEVTLFPINVVSAAEVSGQSVLGKDYEDYQASPGPGDWVGGFIVGASGTTTTTLALDFVFPQGVYAQDSDGVHAGASIIDIEARPVDGAGAPTGPYIHLDRHTFSYATKTPQRATVKYPVADGRYQVRVRKVNSEVNPTQPGGAGGADSTNWVGLRAFLSNTPTSFEGISTVAIRIRANDQLSGSGSHRFAVLRTRKLPVWNGTAWVTQATRNPVWAFYDAATNTDYGAAYPPTKIDFSEVYAHAQGADTRGDTFDYEFTGAVPFPDAFDTILKTTRAFHRWSGDQLTIVRDQWRTVPQLMLTDRETVRDSVEIDLTMNQTDAADAVILEYLDEETWQPASVQYPTEDIVTAVNPSRRRVDGIVNREHAFREAAFYWLQSQLRRTAVTLNTEYDGRVLGLGSHVAVQCELPVIWGSAGRITNRATNTLTLDPPPAWALAGQHYINIRTRLGKPFGPVRISKGVNDSLGVLDAPDLAAVETAQGMTLTTALARADGADEPSFALGTSLARGIVMSGRPNGDLMQLFIVLDTVDVHEGDIGTVLEPGDNPIPVDPLTPTIIGLNASFGQGIAEPKLHASWQPARGAKGYIASVSYDSGVNWEPLYNGIQNNFALVVQPSDLRLRVQAISKDTDRPGPSAVVNVVYDGVEIDGGNLGPGTVDITPFASTIEPVGIVNVLPNPVGYSGKPSVVFLTTDKKLYRYDPSVPEWTSAVGSGDIDPESIDFTKFASGIEPVEIVDTLPNPSGYVGPKVVFLTTDGKLYRYVSGAWTVAVPTVDLTGQIQTAQIVDVGITTAKIADAALTFTKFASGIEPVSVVAFLPNPSGYSGPKTVALTTDRKLYRYVPTGETQNGVVGPAWSKAADGGDIVANSITTASIAAGAITAAEIAAGAITAGKLAVGSGLENILVNGQFNDNGGNTVALPTATFEPYGWQAQYSAGGMVSWAPGTVTNAPTPWTVRLDRGPTLGDSAYVQSRKVPVVGGQKYEVSCWYAFISANSPGGGYLQLYWYGADGTTQVGLSQIANFGYDPAGWVRKALLATAPSNANFAQVFVLNWTESTSRVNTVADVALRKAVGVTVIEDDAITTGKIAANAITAAKIAANTITASQIAANTITAGQIAANTITASEIAANAITASELAADSVVAGKIAAAAINARELAAEAVTAGKIAIGQGFQNMIPNGEFNSDPFTGDTWTSSTGTAAWVVGSTIGAPHPRAIKLSHSGTGATAISKAFPVVGGHKYELSGWLASISAVTGSDLYILLNYYDANGTLISQGGIGPVGSDGNWARHSALVTTPATTRTVRVVATHYAGITNVGFAKIAFRESVGGTVIQDGAIITQHMTAGSIAADRLVSNSITAGQIAAGAINTDELAANSITTGKISVNGVEITNILDGSATQVYSATSSGLDITPATGGIVERLLLSIPSFEVKGEGGVGRVIFQAFVSVASSAAQPLSGGPVTHPFYFRLYIDATFPAGGFYKQCQIAPIANALVTGSTLNFLLFGTFPITHMADLSIGNHRAELRMVSPQAAGGGGAWPSNSQRVDESTLVIMNSRR